MGSVNYIFLGALDLRSFICFSCKEFQCTTGGDLRHLIIRRDNLLFPLKKVAIVAAKVLG